MHSGLIHCYAQLHVLELFLAMKWELSEKEAP